MLVHADSGLPLMEPTAYAMREMRATNHAAATIDQCLSGIRIALEYFSSKGIDLTYRMRVGSTFLKLNEIESIARLCKFERNHILHELEQAEAPLAAPEGESTRSSRGLKLATPAPPVVARQTAYIRLLYISKYVHWLAKSELSRLDGESHKRILLNAAVSTTIDHFKALLSLGGRRNTLHSRRSLSPESLARVLEVIQPESSENPWRSHFNRIRNRLYVYWLLDLSIRKGEALAVMLADIKFPSSRVEILRRPDNSDDPRGPGAPLVKTCDRVLSVTDDLLSCTEEYLELRRKLPGAAQHDYLFVSSWDGSPLSQSAARDIFHALRMRVPDIPLDLSAHIFRHTWNTNFVKYAKRMGLTDKMLLQTMRNQNGWSDKSNMPDLYAAVGIAELAQEQSVEYQQSNREACT